jgi:transposase
VSHLQLITVSLRNRAAIRAFSFHNLASYCRTVDSRRMSNGRKKGDNNQKCGNRYLAWAFVEANFAKRYDDQCRKWFDRKAAKTSTVIATKALACKLAKAAWHVIRTLRAAEPTLTEHLRISYNFMTTGI